jgi:hypothetical protein
VAGNVLVWGTGGLNIDGCRVPMSQKDADTIANAGGFMKSGWEREATGRYNMNAEGSLMPTQDASAHSQGRWPANIVLDGSAAAALDQQSGERPSAGEYTHSLSKPSATGHHSVRMAKTGKAKRSNAYANDSGGASRFFTQADFGPYDWPFVYQAKPSKRERNAGLDGLPEREWREGAKNSTPRSGQIYEQNGRLGAARANHHPTVKPVALMRHLVRLVTPPGGTVLDPFAGSGTTLVAAVLEGFDAIGCEMTDEYLPIIRGPGGVG